METGTYDRPVIDVLGSIWPSMNTYESTFWLASSLIRDNWIAVPKMLPTTRPWKQGSGSTFYPAIWQTQETTMLWSKPQRYPSIAPRTLGGWPTAGHINQLISTACHWRLHRWVDKTCPPDEYPSSHSPSHCRQSGISESTFSMSGQILWERRRVPLSWFTWTKEAWEMVRQKEWKNCQDGSPHPSTLF